MNEPPKACAAVMIRFPDNAGPLGAIQGKPESVVVELYPADYFDIGRGNQFRLRVDGKWLPGPGGPGTYYGLDGLAVALRDQLAEGLAMDRDGLPVSPGTPRGTWVHYLERDSFVERRGRTTTKPFQDPATGEWMVWLVGLRSPVMLADCRPD